MPRDTPTTQAADAAGAGPASAIEVLLDLMDRRDQALADPQQQSRLAWRRRRAIERYWTAENTLRGAELSLTPLLVDEAAAHVAVQDPPARWWMRPEPHLIAAHIDHTSGGRIRMSLDEVIRHLYRDDTLTLDRHDLRLLETCAANAGPDLRALIDRHRYHDRPHEHGHAYPPGHLDQLHAALTSDTTRLPRPVTVYRGEHRSDRDAAFTTAALDARPADLLHRGHLPLSASIDPGAAALIDFSGTGTARAPRTGHEGWILAITTTHALYTGNREPYPGQRSALAEEEKEVLIHAPHLRVTAVTDTLITHPRWQDKRVHLIHTTPEPDAPTH